MLYERYFNIADINIKIESDIFWDVSDKYKIFETTQIHPDVIFKIDAEHQIEFSHFNSVFKDGLMEIFQYEKEIIKVMYTDLEKREIDWCMHLSKDNVYTLYFYQIDKHNLEAFSILYFLELSLFLIKNNAMMLHASVVEYKGKGILFTAPSGTGKSTQASLWEEKLGAEIINGDRAIIRKLHNYEVFGSPLAGSSNIYKNKKVPLRCIVILRQAKFNKIKKISMREAYICLISEFSISPWNREVIDEQSKWVLQLIKEVPVYMLECLPNEDAVKILKNEIEGNID